MRHNHGHAAHLLTNPTFPQTNTHFVTLELLSIIVKLTGYSKTQRSVQLRAARTQNKNAELGERHCQNQFQGRKRNQYQR